MNNQTQETPNTQQLSNTSVPANQNPLKNTGDNLMDAIDTTSLCYSVINDLSTLFRAIKSQSDKYTEAHKIAVIGQYLSEDWANMLDCEGTRLKEEYETKHNVKLT